MNNIHGTPNLGGGGSDRREKHECPYCGKLTMVELKGRESFAEVGVPYRNGGYYLYCPNCPSKYFGGDWVPDRLRIVNERHHIPISRGKSMLSGILAVVCGVTLGAILTVILWMTTR